MYRTAWRCGMRQGSRIVEVETYRFVKSNPFSLIPLIDGQKGLLMSDQVGLDYRSSDNTFSSGKHPIAEVSASSPLISWKVSWRAYY